MGVATRLLALQCPDPMPLRFFCPPRKHDQVSWVQDLLKTPSSKAIIDPGVVIIRDLRPGQSPSVSLPYSAPVEPLSHQITLDAKYVCRVIIQYVMCDAHSPRAAVPREERSFLKTMRERRRRRLSQPDEVDDTGHLCWPSPFSPFRLSRSSALPPRSS